MLFNLVLAVCVATASPEWVEISQQHYRKPVRLTYYPTSDVGVHKLEEDSSTHLTNEQFEIQADFIKPNNAFKEEADHKSYEIYSNISITEKLNRNTFGAPGNIQRVHIDKVTPTFNKMHDPVMDTPEFVTKNVEREKEKVSATIERVSNIGSIKRVHLSDTPVKSPAINDIPKVNNRRNNFETIKDYGDEFETQGDMFKDKISNINIPNGVKTNNKIIPVKNYKIITSTNTPVFNYGHNDETYSAKNNNIKNPFVDTGKDTDSSVQQTQSTPLKNVIESDNIDKILKFDKKVEIIKENEGQEATDFEEVTINNSDSHENVTPSDLHADTTKNTSEEPIKEETNANKDKTQSGEDIKVNTMENLMKFMKVITETISQNSKRGVNGKVKYLNELKDSLLSSIKYRIDASWPDDDPNSRRRSRSTARGHVEFPSSESSLMTISFLTFAVFLIKLVLQVIQTYKNKTMVMAPLVVATAGRAVRKLRDFH